MNFAEILFLLSLDAGSGAVRPDLERRLDYALAGAVLMDLAVQNRVDTDLTCIRARPGEQSRDPLLLRVVDKSPSGDGLLDEALKELQHKHDPRPTRAWLKYFSKAETGLRARVMAQLAARGIIAVAETRKLLVFKQKRCRIINPGELEAVKKRLRELARNDEIPDPREVVLVGLADSCGLFDEILSLEEQARARPRILAIRKLDLIGQAMNGIIRDIEHNLSTEMHSA